MTIAKAVKKVVKEHKKALIGLAHYDLGKKQKDCDCCYCKPEEK